MADTDIELSVKLDTKNISSSARELRKEIKDIFDVQGPKEVNTKMQSLQATMAKTASQSRQVAKEMQAMANTQVPTQEFKEASARVELLSKALEKAADNHAKLAKQGASEEKKKDAREAIRYYEEQIQMAEQDLQELINHGKAFTLGSASEDYQKLVDKSRDLYNQMVITVNKAYELDPTLKEAVRDMQQIEKGPKVDSHGLLSPIESIKEGLRMLKQSLMELPGHLRDFAKALPSNALKLFATVLGKVNQMLVAFGRNLVHGMVKKGLSHFTKSLHSSNKGLAHGFFQILRYAIGIRSLYTLFHKVNTAIKEGVNNVAQWNNGNNKTNQSLSMLKSSLAQMKNAIGTVAASILNIAAPAINQIIQLITQLATAIARLIATVSGAKTFIQAKAVQEDYAKSLNKSSKAAKNLQLAIDELNVLDDSSSGGGTDPNSMFEEVPLEPFDLKEALRNIDWNSIKDEAEKLGRHFADILNSIFADEELASEIGHAIGECINTAIHFAYGFVDELNWLQMGRWLGTLVQEGITTIEWGLLGQTIGQFVNGLADTVIGFFQTYNVGTLGASIAEMFNRAVHTIDPTKVGTALGEVIAAPLVEITTFLKEADIATATQKMSTIIQTILTGDLFGDGGKLTAKGKTLGTIIGEGLAAAINAGMDILINADITKLVDSLGQFIEDAFYAAISNIDWADVIQALANLGVGIIYLVFNKPIQLLLDFIGQTLKEIAKLVKDYDTEMYEQLFTAGEKLKLMSDDIATTWKDSVDSINADWDSMDIENKVTTASDNVKTNISSNGQDIETTLQEMEDAGIHMSDSMKQSLINTANAQSNTKKSAEDMSQGVTKAYSDMSTNVGKSTGETTKYIDVSKSKFDEGVANANNYDTNTKVAFDNVATNAQNAQTSVSNVGETINTELENVTTIVDTWYQNLMEQYFSYDAWSGVFSDGMLTALNEVMESFTSTWKTNMDTWLATNDTLYFNTKTWTTRWEVITNTYKTMWTSFTKTWKANMTIWLAQYVKPNFEKTKWEAYGKNMEEGIHGGFKGIVGKIGTLINQIVDMFNTAMTNMTTAMNNLIRDFNASAGTLGVNALPSVAWANIAKVPIPKLAQGAVIPPNKEFMAVLGDQTSGTNIEAPLTTIQDAVSQVLQPYLERLISITEDIYDKDTSVNIGDDEIAAAAIRGQRNMGLNIRRS